MTQLVYKLYEFTCGSKEDKNVFLYFYHWKPQKQKITTPTVSENVSETAVEINISISYKDFSC